MNARAAAERTSTASPPSRLEGGVVAVVEADLAREEPILVELGIAGTADGIHLVEALPGEADAGRAVAAVEAALDRAEDEFAAPLRIEADVGGLDQVEEVAVPQRHLDDPPLAQQGMITGGHRSLAGRSAGLLVLFSPCFSSRSEYRERLRLTHSIHGRVAVAPC